jgi:hypothetical protein
MKSNSSKRVSNSYSENRKSKIENLKWGGLVALALTFALFGAGAWAQQPKKVHRIGYLSAQDPTRESTRSEAIRLALRELGYINSMGLLSLRPSWCVSELT